MRAEQVGLVQEALDQPGPALPGNRRIALFWGFELRRKSGRSLKIEPENREFAPEQMLDRLERYCPKGVFTGEIGGFPV